MSSPETTRIIALLDFLKFTNVVAMDKDFAEAIGFAKQSLSGVRKGERNIPSSYFSKIESVYGVTRNFITRGALPVFRNDSQYAYLNNTIDTDPIAKQIITGKPTTNQANENIEQYNAKHKAYLDFPIEPKADTDKEFIDLGDGQMLMIIPRVPEYAYMGYLDSWSDPEYIEELPKFSIVVNKVHRGKYRAFDALGDSMENWEDENLMRDSIQHGSVVIGREIQRHHWKSKFHTHKWPDFVIVHNRGILIKRIKNHDVNNGIITLTSLNPNKELYPDEDIFLDDVKEIYNVVDVSKPR